MRPVSKQKSKEGQKLPLFDLIAEIYGWLQIVVASVIVGFILSFSVYFIKPGKTRLIAGIAIIALALIVGIILATNAWKQKGITLFGPEPSEFDQQEEGK